MSADFEQQIRDKLAQAGLLDRMKSLFLDAAMDVVKNDADPSRSDPRLLKPSPAFLENSDTESFAMSMAMIVDFLRQYGLLHTLNCLKSECGTSIFPPETDDETEEEIKEEREALCEDLDLSIEGSILERVYEKATKAPSTTQGNITTTSAAIQQQSPMKTHTLPPVEQEKQQSPAKQEQPSPSKSSAASSSAASSQAPSPAKSTTSATSPVKQQQQQEEEKTATKSNAPPGAKEYPIVPISNSKNKGSETPYTVEWYDGGEFVRYNKITGQPFVVEYMKNCRIIILDAIDNITMDDCENCEVIVAACENSAFIRTCKNITLRIACKQLRTRDCEDCDIFLYTNTDPVVESSFGMNFYPYNIETPQLCDRFKAARFDPSSNRFVHVYDFTADTVLGGGKTHFTVHWPDHKNTQMMRYGMGVDEAAIESPPEIKMLLDHEIEPGQSLERGAGKALNIKTGASTWQQQQVNTQKEQGQREEQAAATAAPTGVTRPQSAPATTTAAATKKTAEQETSAQKQQRPATATATKSVVPPISGVKKETSDAAEADPYVLKRDSSSDDSSFSSYDESDDFEKTDEDDDDTF